MLDAIEKDLSAAKADYRDLVDKELPAFNRSLAEHGVTPVASAMPYLMATIGLTRMARRAGTSGFLLYLVVAFSPWIPSKDACS